MNVYFNCTVLIFRYSNMPMSGYVDSIVSKLSVLVWNFLYSYFLIAVYTNFIFRLTLCLTCVVISPSEVGNTLVWDSQWTDPSGGWNPGVCSECQALFKAADSEPFRGNNKDILKELARKIAQKCKSATYPRQTIFLNEEVGREFRRSWFGKTISDTGTSIDLESVNP